MRNNNPVLDMSFLTSQKRVDEIYRKLLEYKGKHGGIVKTMDGSGGKEYENALTLKYAFCTSILLGLFGDNVRGKKIVEVGPGYAGRFMLDYLTECGADAFGIDLHLHIGYTGSSRGRYKVIPWERISEEFSPSTIDLIHVKSMCPNPYPEEVGRKFLLGNFFQRWMARRYISRYGSVVANGSDKVLRDGGHFVLWHKHDDFSLNPMIFNKKGYSHNSFEIPHEHMGQRFNLDVYQKAGGRENDR